MARQDTVPARGGSTMRKLLFILAALLVDALPARAQSGFVPGGGTGGFVTVIGSVPSPFGGSVVGLPSLSRPGLTYSGMVLPATPLVPLPSPQPVTRNFAPVSTPQSPA